MSDPLLVVMTIDVRETTLDGGPAWMVSVGATAQGDGEPEDLFEEGALIEGRRGAMEIARSRMFKRANRAVRIWHDRKTLEAWGTPAHTPEPESRLLHFAGVLLALSLFTAVIWAAPVVQPWLAALLTR